LLIGVIFVLPFISMAAGFSFTASNIIGMLGPYISASTNATFAPVFANAIAKLTATVDFPTPPLPEATAIIFLIPFKKSLLSVLRLVTLDVKLTSTTASLSTTL